MDNGTVRVGLENALLHTEEPSAYFEDLRGSEQLDGYFPELEALIGVPQNTNYHREGDVWVHTMMVTDEAAKRRGIVEKPLGFMLSALCHDFGKAVSTAEVNGVVHSIKHEIEGLPIVRRFLERFGYDDDTVHYVLNMTELHMEPNILAGARSRIKKTNRLFDISAAPTDLIQLAVCDALGKIPQGMSSEKFLTERYDMFLEIMARPFVDEEALTAAGIQQDDSFAEVLSYAHKLRLAGFDRDNSLRQCIAYAKNLKKI